MPTEPATTVRIASMSRAGQLPPDGGRDDDGEAEQEQPDPVAAVLGLEVAGRPADPAGDRADGVGDAEPDAATPRPSAVKPRSTGPGPVRTARGAGRRLDAGLRDRFFVVLRDRVVEACAPSTREADREDAALLREPGGEDVRVAMVTNLGHCHSSHTDHTPHRPVSGCALGSAQRRSSSPRR